MALRPHVLMQPGFQVDASRFIRMVRVNAAAMRRDAAEVGRSQFLLLCKELTKRTPPLSGKAIAKIVEARGYSLKQPELATLRERQIGDRAIERDRNKIARQTGLEGDELRDEIARRKANVGRAKAGWQPGFARAGGRLPGKGTWIGRHGTSQGSGTVTLTKDRFVFEGLNTSQWAGLGEAPRIVLQSIARRERAMASQTRRALEKRYGRGAGKAFA